MHHRKRRDERSVKPKEEVINLVTTDEEDDDDVQEYNSWDGTAAAVKNEETIVDGRKVITDLKRLDPKIDGRQCLTPGVVIRYWRRKHKEWSDWLTITAINNDRHLYFDKDGIVLKPNSILDVEGHEDAGYKLCTLECYGDLFSVGRLRGYKTPQERKDMLKNVEAMIKDLEIDPNNYSAGEKIKLDEATALVEAIQEDFKDPFPTMKPYQDFMLIVEGVYLEDDQETNPEFSDRACENCYDDDELNAAAMSEQEEEEQDVEMSEQEDDQDEEDEDQEDSDYSNDSDDSDDSD